MFQSLELDFSSIFTFENILKIVISILIIVGIFLADVIVRKIINRYSKKVNLDLHAVNLIKLMARILVFAFGLVALLQYLGIGTDWVLGVSAFSGAAVGFASTQTVGNFLAGLYIMVTRPFMIRDYVRIGDVEGEVHEITINYTKIYTPTYNLTEIPNRRVLDSIIHNYSTKKDIIDYSFEISFPHSDILTNEELIENCIIPGIEEFYLKHGDLLPKKPEVGMSKMDRWGRFFLIRMFYPEGDVTTFYDIQPDLLKNITNRWDLYKNQKK